MDAVIERARSTTTSQIVNDCLQSSQTTFGEIIGQIYHLHCHVVIKELGPDPTETKLVNRFAETCGRHPTILHQYASGESMPVPDEIRFLGSRWGLTNCEIDGLITMVESQRYDLRRFGTHVPGPGFNPTGGLPPFLKTTDKDIIDFSWRDGESAKPLVENPHGSKKPSSRWAGIHLLRALLCPLAEDSKEGLTKLEDLRIRSGISVVDFDILLFGGGHKGPLTSHGCAVAATLLSDGSPLNLTDRQQLFDGLPASWHHQIKRLQAK